MRVLFLTHSFPRHDGDAAGSFVLRLATALERAGVTVQVVAPAARDLAAQARLDGVPVSRFRYAPRALETLAYAGNMAAQVKESWPARLALGGMLCGELRSARRATRETSPDLIHAHWWFPSGLVASAARALGGVPFVTTFHGSDVRLVRSIPAARPLLRQVMRRSARVTAVSRWLATQAHEVAGDVMPIVAPMPAATELFFPDADVRRGDALLFVGRLTRQKGIDLLLRAVALLPASISLDVVGDGEEGATLQALAASLGIDGRVRWHGAKPVDALAVHYRGALALVVPSTEEGLGLVAVEAQLCGTPVIAFASGGLVDVIEHEVTGLLVAEHDPAALADAARDLLRRDDRGASLGRAGRARALTEFAPDVAARRYLDIYRAALEHAPR